MKPQELIDMLLAACGGSFQFNCNTALEAVDVVRDLMEDLDVLNLALKANKEMLKSETARANNAEEQRDELLEDAKRYRWLRDESPHYKSPARQGTEVGGFGLKVVFQQSGTDARSLPLRFLSGAVLDSVTDAAIASVKGGA